MRQARQGGISSLLGAPGAAPTHLHPVEAEPVGVGAGAVEGVDAVPVTVEAKVGGSGAMRLLGNVDGVVKEGVHRVLAAFQAQGLHTPRGAPMVNFRPAAVRKVGAGFDLAMALALAGADRQFPVARSSGLAAHGELGLQGQVLPVRGAVAVALACRDAGRGEMVMSRDDAALAAVVPGITVHGVDDLAGAVRILASSGPQGGVTPLRLIAGNPGGGLDLEDIRGHTNAKRALAVAAAGRHNLLFSGPPGSGKSALIRRLPPLLAPLPEEHLLEALKILTLRDPEAIRRLLLLGAGTDGTVLVPRPFRAPHHSSSTAAVLGGGAEIRPGEVTLAHRGVLFLDELPEFRRETLESLRQPLEEDRVVLGRAARTVDLPADVQLVAAMNPCPCGYLGHPIRPCRDTPAQVHRYRSRLSGPLLDRIDLQVEVPALDPAEFRATPEPGWDTATVQARVQVAIDRQRSRNRGDVFGTGGTGARAQGAAHWIPNGRLDERAVLVAVQPSGPLMHTLEEVMAARRLSGRARIRLLRIARTLADLADRDEVGPADVLEAATLRGGIPLPV